MNYDFLVPTKIKINTRENFEKDMKGLEGRKIVFVVSDTMEKRYGLTPFLGELENKNQVERIRVVAANPTESDVEKSLLAIEEDFDTVIALGGGSAIDLAKGIIALYHLKEAILAQKNIRAIIQTKKYVGSIKKVDFIAVPTTAGTSAEITSWATIWSSDNTLKMSIDDPKLAPDCAYVIPELTMTLSKRMTLATGLDALCHATESYWSKKSNMISRELSKTSIKIIVANLPKVLENPEDMESREQMCLGAVFAGLAFANTRTTACHSMSYPLTMKHGVEHGFAVAATLIEVMKKNIDAIIDIDGLLEAFSVKDIEGIQLWMDQVCGNIQSLRLRSFGIPKEDIRELTEMSFTAGRMDNNPVILDESAVEHILISVYE